VDVATRRAIDRFGFARTGVSRLARQSACSAAALRIDDRDQARGRLADRAVMREEATGTDPAPGPFGSLRFAQHFDAAVLPRTAPLHLFDETTRDAERLPYDGEQLTTRRLFDAFPRAQVLLRRFRCVARAQVVLLRLFDNT
jgi:hypothetical protein